MGTAARVVVLPQKPGVLEVQELTLPDPGPTQVVVKQYASGVCHSQLHQMHRERNSPILLGHESTGVILKAGSAVAHVEEGDVVLVTWVPRAARYAAGLPVRATLEVAGGTAQSENVFTWADQTLCDEQYVVKTDANIKKDVTSIIGCAVMTGAGAVINTAGVKAGESVAIFGVGGVGLSAVVGARMAGASPIIAIDLDDAKLEFAERFGATHTINAGSEDAVATIHAMTVREGEYTITRELVNGADYAFDCIGLRQTMEQIAPACRTCHFGERVGGTAVLVGVPSSPVELDAIDMLINEKQFRGSIGGSCSPDKDFPTFLQWYADGHLPLEEMVTERYSIDQINEATTALEEGKISGRAILEF